MPRYAAHSTPSAIANTRRAPSRTLNVRMRYRLSPSMSGTSLSSAIAALNILLARYTTTDLSRSICPTEPTTIRPTPSLIAAHKSDSLSASACNVSRDR